MTPRLDPRLIPAFPDFHFEASLWAAETRHVAGVDEAGRGALAGPIAAAVLIFPTNVGQLQGLNRLRDSKGLTPNQRARWLKQLQDVALAWQVGFAKSAEIDALGVIPATRLAIQRALDALPLSPDHLLIDHLLLPENPIPQTSLTKGDLRSLSIAAASIFAKVHRDRRMCELDRSYPGYAFDRNKGYGTRAHRTMLTSQGPSPVHRTSFAPLKHMERLSPHVEPTKIDLDKLDPPP